MKIHLSLLLIFWSALVGADHKPDAEWSWHLVSAGADESRLALYLRDQPLGIYNLECNLTDASEGDHHDGDASINLVKPETHPDGLLVVSCDVGAHSRLIVVFDLQTKSKQEAFSVTGSYAASWGLQDGELWFEYDEPCDTGPSVECPDGFVTIFKPLAIP